MSQSDYQVSREEIFYKLKRRLYNLQVDIETEINIKRPRRSSQPGADKEVSIDLAARFAHLREDVKKYTKDEEFNRLNPPIWYVPPIYLIVAILIIIAVLFGVAAFLWPSPQSGSSQETSLVLVLMIFLFPVLLFFFVLGITEFDIKRLVASNLKTIRSRARRLDQYLEEQQLPSLEDIQGEIQYYRNYNRDLSSEIHTLEDRVSQFKLEANQLRQKLIGQAEPLEFEVDQTIFDKLNSLERTRFTEAIMSYRIQAWTPAAAVCGMLLEGRLQVLCRQNKLPLGSFNTMIQNLYDAGLLKGHHQSLARVGEFFRHRSSHPTTEEFDREKTTLVITTLIILIREVF